MRPSYVSPGLSELIPELYIWVISLALVSGGCGSGTVSPHSTALSCSSATPTVDVGQLANFTATNGTGSYSWSAPKGTPTSGSGASFSTKYFASGNGIVSVTSGSDLANCSVSVNKVSISVSPKTVSLNSGVSRQFAAAIKGAVDTNVVWTTTGGSINANGLYLAPEALGTYYAKATSFADPTKSDTATVTVTASTPITVTVSPKTVKLATGDTQQFTASVMGTTDTQVTWTATGGTVSLSGLYVAPGTAGTYYVTATSVADTTKWDTLTVTVLPVPGSPMSVAVRGGALPISGAAIQLYAAGTTGYGVAATALLTAPVFTDDTGAFSISGAYTCPSESIPVYLVVSGGNPGFAPGTNNSAVALMAGLGPCGELNPTAVVRVNEVTTIASVWALARFMELGAGAYLSSSDGNAQGLANAFATINTLADISQGIAPGANLPPGATVPINELNALADMLEPCVSSDGPASSACSNLFAAATPEGGTPPTNTIDAALNIARSPAHHVDRLYNLIAQPPAFQPILTSIPTDWTVAVSYTGGGVSSPDSLAVDASGNIWVSSRGGSRVSKFSNLGVPISPSEGFTGGGIDDPWGAVIDLSGNFWSANSVPNSLVEFSSAGVALSPATGYQGGGLYDPRDIAVDRFGHIWVANLDNSSVSEFLSDGRAISPSGGYTGGGVSGPMAIATDSIGNIWVANFGPNSVSKLSNSGNPISPSTGYTGGGLNSPWDIAIDAAGNVWTANRYNNSLTKLSSSGVPISGSEGYTGGGLNCPFGIAIDGSGNVWVTNFFDNVPGLGTLSEFSNDGVPISPATGYASGGLDDPWGIAIDSSGNVWVGNVDSMSGSQPEPGNTITEFVGAATPVMTPIASAAEYNKLGSRP